MPKVTLDRLGVAKKEFVHWLHWQTLDNGYWKGLAEKLHMTEVTLRSKRSDPDKFTVGELRKIRSIVHDDEMFYEKLRAIL